MSLGRFRSTVLASALVLSAGRANAAGSAPPFAGFPPPPPEPEGAASDPFHKPPVPVSFLSHDAGWISFQYPPSARDRVGPLIARAADVRAELAEALGQTPLDGVEVRIARGPEEMVTLAPPDAAPTPEASGTTYPKLKLVILSLGGASASDASDLLDAFRRELAGLALDQAIAQKWVPSWFSAGFSVHYSREGEWAREWSLFRAALGHRTEPIASLDRLLARQGADTSLPLAEGADFVGYLQKPQKHARFATVVERIRRGDGFEAALSSGYGSDLGTLEREWRSELGRRTTLLAVLLGVGLPALVMIAVGLYRRFKKRKLQQRAQELRDHKGSSGKDKGRVHIVLGRKAEERIEPAIIAEAEIPKVEHEGEWHTLH